MAGVNKVILVGNLGKDPEVRHLDTGVSVASFSLATTESYNNKQGERVNQTEWHNIVVWRGLADVAEKYLNKGNSVYIEGKIQTRKWEDKEGNTRYSTDIIAEKMTMLGSKPQSQQDEVTDTSLSKDETSRDDIKSNTTEEDDLPF
tara:strand:+ start:860 stop:1297 length:438 start_codon:yes stop_codon:yes gene_type:complete